MFSVRIVTTDHYMAPPIRGLDVQYADQRGAEVKKVPVVRIFGATPAGQKTCMHVHGVFPYLYVPYDGTAPLDRYLRQFASSLDKAINVAQGHGQSTIQHVYKIVLVSGIAMYGYHDKEEQFLKIYLYNPAMIKKAADLLLGGAVLNKAFQPHEAHIPYTLQLFIDYNLYGMNMINVGAVKFRRRHSDDNDNLVIVRDVSYPGSQGSDEGLGSDQRTPMSFTGLLNRSGTMTPSRRTWDRENIPSELYLDVAVERQSTCDLEVDVVAADILNRLEVNDNVGANPGLAALWEDERQRRRERGESTDDIAPPDSQERVNIERAESEVELETRLHDIVLQQLAFIDSHSQSELEESQDIPATPASAVELHLSQIEDDLLQSSQETVMLDEDDLGEKPVVNINSIHKVVSSSHSFCEVRARNEDVSIEDKSLVDILASLAEESDTPPSSQVAAVTQVTALEEQDSILSQVSAPRDRDVEEREAEEVLEMSQRIWDEDMTLPSQEHKQSPMETDLEQYDLAGLDDTWQGSEVDSREQSDDDSSDSDDIIPQLDGQADEKPKSPRKRGPKRLGVNGPVRYPGGMPQQMYPPGFMPSLPYHGMPPNPQYPGNYYGNYGPPGLGYGQWRPGMQPGQVPHPQNPMGMMPNSQMQPDPRMQQSPRMQQHSPRMQQQQQSPGVLQNPGGIEQSPHLQTSPGVLQSPHMQKSPGHHNSPGSQQSPGMLQSPVGNFSPQGASGWEQSQTYSSPNSPPVVSVYGAKKSQQSASIVSTQSTGITSASSQYQPFPANTYSYHQPVPNATATSHTNSTAQSGYASGMSDTPQQASSGYPPDGQKRYHLAHPFNPGYSQHPFPFGGMHHPMGYPAPYDQSLGTMPKSSTETVPGNFNARNRANMPGVNAQQVSPSWQQRAAVPPTQAQRFPTPNSVVGNIGSQHVNVPETTTDSIRNYSGYKNSLTIQATGSMENQFPNIPLDSVVPETQRRKSFPGNSGERTFDNISQKDWTSPNASTSNTAQSLGSQSSSVMTSPGIDTNVTVQSRPNVNISEENAARDRQTPEWIAIPQNAQVSNDSKCEASVSDTRRIEVHKQQLYPQHPGNIHAQNFQNAAQNYHQWTNHGVAQPVTTSVPNSVLHHIPKSVPKIDKNLNKSQEALKSPPIKSPSMKSPPIKSPPKPLQPPAEGPISRYYRQKLAHITGESTGELKSPEGNGIAHTSTPLSSPVNSVTSPPNTLSSPVNTGEKSNKALQKLLLQQQTSQTADAPERMASVHASETLSVGSGEIVPGSRRSSSLTSLLMEEDNEKPIVWEQNSVFQHHLFSKGSVEKLNLNHLKNKGSVDKLNPNPLHIHSINDSAEVNLSANQGNNMTGLVGLNRNSISRHSLDSNVGANVSAYLSDNSQDLFSERSRTMSENGSLKNDSRLGNDQAGDDSVSVFSDSMTEVQSGDNQSIVDDCRKSVPSSESVESGKQDDLSSLSDLRSFVGSVQKGSEYGANFQRSEFHKNTEDIVTHEPAINNPSGHFPIGSFKDNGLVTPAVANMNNPAQSQLQSNLVQPGMPKPKRKYTRRDPNASPIRKSVKGPDIPGLKKRRGRPKKDSFVNMQNNMLVGQGNFMNASVNENFPGQQFHTGYQNQQLNQQGYNYQNYNQQGYYPQSSYSDQTSLQNQQFYQQQFQNQTPQDQIPAFAGAEAQQVQNEPVQRNIPLTAEEEVENATAFLVQNEQELQQSQSSFLGELMAENDSFDFQQATTSSCSDSVTTENDQIIGQPGMIENSEANMAMNMDDNDDNFNYNEMRNRASQEMQEFHKQQEMLSKSIMESGTLKFKFKSAAQKEKEEQKMKEVKSYYSVETTNIVSPRMPSSAYTFQFKVPTSVYKRLKLRLGSDSLEALSNVKIVRMHPKDARKYSLMKIGKEMVQLYKLTDNEIEQLQEDLISGKEVFSIPPAIRQAGNVLVNSNVVEGTEKSEMSPNVLQDNQKYLTQLDQDGNNVQAQKRKKVTASMFKNRNIANIPHLKKYRAGFPYFGKGNIGKKVPSKQSHPVLSPELEEDNDVVIKDVSLIDASEGTLTPIKSRTPIAGRSPAHAGSHILESEHKEYLDQKLKDFEGDLELSSQTNEPQIFDEGESSLFDHEKQVNEFEGSTDTEENEMNEIADENETSELYDISKQVLENEGVIENKIEAGESDELLGAKSQSVIENTDKNEENMKTEAELQAESGTEKMIEEMNWINKSQLDSRKEKINKMKQEISKKNELLEKVKEALIDMPEKYARSRSNSIETYSSCKSSGSSRRDSLSNSVDGRARRLSSVESYIANQLRKEKRKRSSSSSSSRNKHSCKSSITDQENKHKRRKTHTKKKKKKKHQSHSGSDSDGIPGVDYIVIGFKGCRQMRVGLHKLDVDESDSVSAEEMLKFVSKKEKLKPRRHKNDNSKEFEVPLVPKVSNSQPKSPVSNCSAKPNTFSGFSAEFAKFLAQGRNENEKENEVLKRIRTMPGMLKQTRDDFVKPDSKANSEDNSSKGEPGSRGTMSENSEGSENEQGESSTSDMCLSTNHSFAHENVSTVSSVDDVFLGNTGDNSDMVASNEEILNKSMKKHSLKKKKGNTIHDRMSRAFVGKRRKKHKHSPRKSSKFSNSLNALYDATIENLQPSPVKENYEGPIKLKINLKSLRRSPDFELYSDDVDSDYDAPFCDTMYKLAWYSPPESETGELSPPQPLSPEQMSDIENLENNVKKIPPSIIHGSSTVNKSKNRSGRSTPVRSNEQSAKEYNLNVNDLKMTVNANSPLMGEKSGLREERLTFADIQKSLKSANSSEMETDKNSKEDKLTFKDDQKEIKNVNSQKTDAEKCLKEVRVTLSDIRKTMNKANLSEMEGEKQLKEQKLTFAQIKKVVNETNNSLNNKDSVEDKKETEENIRRNTSSDKEVYVLKEAQPRNTNNIINSVDSDMKTKVSAVENVREVEKAENIKVSNKLPEDTGVHMNLEEVALSHFPLLTVNVEDNELFADDESESVDSNRSNEENVSPPDLGPPIIPRFSPRLYQASSHRNDPPPLTIGKETIYINSQDSSAQLTRNDKEGNFLNTPPNLVSCKSPGSASFSSISPRQLFASPNQNVGAVKRRPGHSPAACSSSSSINVVHSEQFSDISDEESDYEVKCSQVNIVPQRDSDSQRDVDFQHAIDTQLEVDSQQDMKSQQESSQVIVCDESFSKPPTLSKTRTNIINYLSKAAAGVIRDNIEKEMKLKDIAEFEKRNHTVNILSEKGPPINKVQLDRERMRNNIIEFERNHEAINLSRNCNIEKNTGKTDFKRRHSVPLFNTNISPYSNHTIPTMNPHIAQNIPQENFPVDCRVQNLESCKYSQKRPMFVGPSNPKYMADCEPQNGYKRHPGLEERDFNMPVSFNRSFSLEARNPFEEPPVKHSSYTVHNMMSPSGFHRNFSDTCVNNPRNHPILATNRGNVFERFSQNISRFPTVQTGSNNDLPHPQRRPYSICKNRRISESIIRSVTNHCQDERNGLDLVPVESLYSNGERNPSDIPFTRLGTGGNKEIRHTGLKQSGGGNQSGGEMNDKQDKQSMSDKSSGSGGGDNTATGDNRTTNKHGSLQTSACCQVITPLTAPPTRECVYELANQYGLSSVQAKEAFYGNPKDAPHRPREGGGQVLKVSSNMVKCLREFDTAGKIEGLLSWRNKICAKENLFSSQQEESTSLCDRLEKEHALKYALTGDKTIVVTPCLLPPPKNKVEEWCKGRELYKALKRQTGIPKIRTENVETDSGPNRSQGPDNVTTERQIEDVRLNLFTGRREVIQKHYDLIEEDKPPVLVREEPDLVDIKDGPPKSRITKSRPDDDDVMGLSPSSKQLRLDDSSQLHSTPMVKRRSSADLFDASYTPIAADRESPTFDGNRPTPAIDSSGRVTPTGRETPTQEGEDQAEGHSGEGFVTPKRIRPPLRRLSTNTERSLRRAIINTQMKQQFCTPSLHKEASQIEGPTPKNSFGFKHSQQNLQDAKALHENQYLTVMSVELHVETRGDLRPDPEFDSIKAIFYSIFNDVPPESGTRHQTGAILVDPDSASQNQPFSSAANGKDRKVSHVPVPGTSKSHDPRSCDDAEKKTFLQKCGIVGMDVMYVKDETELIKAFMDFIKKWDPDILVGYEIQLLSWGYLLQRASTLNTNMAVAISRIPTAKTSSHMSAEKDEFGADYASEIHIAGRIVLNLWRLLRHEVTLNIYTYENVAFHVLHRRVPLFSFRNLTSWFKHRTHVHRWKVVEHYVNRAKGNLELIEQLDIIGRTSEFARVFGIEFYHVLSRGSQYRVESMMLRVAKPMNYIPVSPSVHQRARMKAPECIPLTLEPESRFYTDPVVVLDFQSLYPSIMIGYNYCFSTCMGRVDWLAKAHEGPIEFGCTSLNVPPSVLKKRQDDLTYSPNSVAFVKQSVKRGVLPVMVEEILKTRLMVKKAMKSYKGDKTLSRMLDARQLGLKLIANVTYGYTGANFSGRMPCIEVGDSIVRKARETLERSIKLVEETPKWGAKVIYGDTDSMFLLMKGKSKDEAFRIGQEIADTVTKMFPKPVKLKFEKVYLPCVLQTKKRYVGFMYETPDQKEPVFDAKGIETVRRDSCPAVSKILERSIKILFQSRDVSQLKSYMQQQCQKLMEGTVSLQDCIFAKEFRGMSGYRPGACVPALEIAKKLIRQDRRAEPRVGERVPYVIVYGSPGLPLIQLVKQPMELLQDGSLRLNATYYITKQILPPLSRFLSLLGVDVFSWYQEMPHTSARALAQTASPRKGTISQYFATSNCPICDDQTKQPICPRCMREPQMVCVTLNDKISRWERLQDHLNKVCSTCMGCSDLSTVKSCISLDCPILYRQWRAQADVNRASTIREILAKVFK